MGVQDGARLEQRPGIKAFNEKKEEGGGNRKKTTQAKKAKKTSKESSCKSQMVRKKTENKMGKSIKAKVLAKI